MLCAEGGAEIVPIFAQEMGFTEQSWRQWARQQLEASLHVYVHIDKKSRLKQVAAIATAPLVLFMHATNPSMHIGVCCSLIIHLVVHLVMHLVMCLVMLMSTSTLTRKAS